MSKTVIRVENLYKEYKLGVINHGTLAHDLQSWWARIRGKEDPNSLISNQYNFDAEKNSFLALKDINFEVNAGDRVGIIGKNGAGKSTLLKILSRITSPTKGNIKIKGRVGSLLEVGTGFHPELSGRENIYLNGAILGMNRREINRKLEEIIDFSGVEKYIDTPVKRYSSGMNVRLGFAIAAYLEPEILIVDEILAVGDAEFQKRALGKMESVSRTEGRTILFVSHNMGAVQRLCKYGIYLKNGELNSQGDINSIIDLYLRDSDTNYGLPLLDRIDRRGNGKVKFKDVKIINDKGVETTNIFMGDKFTIKMTLEGKAENVIICVYIGNGLHTQIIGCRSDETSSSVLNLLESVNELTCTIKNFPLMYGVYSIHLKIADPYQLMDHVENAMSFNLEYKNIYDSKKIYRKDTGIAVCNCTWGIIK